jgi:hypothetical protein
MNCVVTKGRTEPCRDNIGGIKFVYLFNWANLLPNQIVIEDGFLVSIPSADLYKYEIVNGNFTQSIQNDENGVVYNQTLSFDLFKQDLLTTNQIKTLKDIDFRYVVQFEDGKLQVGGLFNGANISQLSMTTGGGKGELNGYQITFESLETVFAPYITGLDIITGGVFNYIFMSGDNFIFMDENNYIFN